MLRTPAAASSATGSGRPDTSTKEAHMATEVTVIVQSERAAEQVAHAR
ncbi:MAG: hypothetical protein ACREQ5_21160 [Candidatus Dormibacteria bacterium]